MRRLIEKFLLTNFWAACALTATTWRRKRYRHPAAGKRWHHPHQISSIFFALRLLISLAAPLLAADPEIDRLLQSPVARDWVTNGGNLTNQRYSTLSQIDKTNVNYLKGAWMTRLSRSGFGRKYSAEATPLVKDGIMYMVTGNDDVFALSAKTGEILWKRWSLIDQKISTVCCGWDNRGLAMGEGMLFLGQLDANVVALDIQTGREVWRTPIEGLAQRL